MAAAGWTKIRVRRARARSVQAVVQTEWARAGLLLARVLGVSERSGWSRAAVAEAVESVELKVVKVETVNSVCV